MEYGNGFITFAAQTLTYESYLLAVVLNNAAGCHCYVAIIAGSSSAVRVRSIAV